MEAENLRLVKERLRLARRKRLQKRRHKYKPYAPSMIFHEMADIQKKHKGHSFPDVCFVEGILMLHARYASIVSRGLADNQVVKEGLERAMSHILNYDMGTVTNTELVGHYCDYVLNRRYADRSEEELDHDLDTLSDLVAHITDRDLFHRVYKSDLSMRLLEGSIHSHKLERSMFARLKVKADYRLVSHLEHMVADVEVSHTLSSHFTRLVQNSPVKEEESKLADPSTLAVVPERESTSVTPAKGPAGVKPKDKEEDEEEEVKEVEVKEPELVKSTNDRGSKSPSADSLSLSGFEPQEPAEDARERQLSINDEEKRENAPPPSSPPSSSSSLSSSRSSAPPLTSGSVVPIVFPIPHSDDQDVPLPIINEQESVSALSDLQQQQRNVLALMSNMRERAWNENENNMPSPALNRNASEESAISLVSNVNDTGEEEKRRNRSVEDEEEEEDDERKPSSGKRKDSSKRPSDEHFLSLSSISSLSHLFHNRPNGSMGALPLSVVIMTRGMWPSTRIHSLRPPPSFERAITAFDSYYGALPENARRSLSWIPNLGSVHACLNLPTSESIPMMMTTAQAMVLSLFNPVEQEEVLQRHDHLEVGDTDKSAVQDVKKEKETETTLKERDGKTSPSLSSSAPREPVLLSYEQIRCQLEVKPDILTPLLHSLCCGAFRVLCRYQRTSTNNDDDGDDGSSDEKEREKKENNNSSQQEVDEEQRGGSQSTLHPLDPEEPLTATDLFSLNLHFKLPRGSRGVRLPLPLLEQRQRRFKKENKKIVYDAIIVRLLKRKKTSTVSNVCEYICEKYPHFNATEEEIIPRIDHLIDHDYIERDPVDADIVHYVT